MRNQPATPKELTLVGVVSASAGVYFLLIGLSILPVPGGSRNLHAPLWIVLLVGLVFFLGGLAVAMQALGRANADGEFPAGTPLWMSIVQYAIGVAIFASFALIGSWIALAGESRQFSGTLSFVGRETHVPVARFVFGLGAALCWFATIGFAVSRWRKLFGGNRPA